MTSCISARLVACLMPLALGTLLAVGQPAWGQEAEGEAELDREALLAQYAAWAVEFNDSLNRQTGTVELPGGIAKLELGDRYYYLSASDANRVLIEAWGNESGGNTHGMIFPAEYAPTDDGSWGVAIDYTADGYVSDEDAGSIDYGDLLRDMQEATREESKQRVEAGYEAAELVGWASPPRYDAAEHKLHWAKEIKFGDSPENTLNYNIRVLGRKGVLELNFIAGMSQLPEIEQRRDSVMSAVSFNPGYRYSEFDPSIDKIAAYGIGGLVAGKVLLKTGLLVKLALVFKKFWIILLIGGGAVAKKFFGGSSDDSTATAT